MLFIAWMTLPTTANDYLKIYFKDGHTECHYMKLVENISATKYDLEGNLHNNYQMQQIVMKDTTYSYYLADIDSMSFKKVYEEQVKADVEQVSNTITPIFEQCSTIEEMETHIDEIKAMNCVEDVWREGSDIVVQIRDWKKVFYKYPLVSDSDFSRMWYPLTRNSESQLPIKNEGTPMKVGIAFQMVDDPRFDDNEADLIKLNNRFQQLGFDSHYIDVLDFDFFNRDMFDYDILFLATHGSYSGGKHYLCTSIETDLKQDLIWEIFNSELGSVGIDYDDISYSFFQTGKYMINFGTFIVISEDYIRKSQYKFTGSGPHIVFNAACSSLKGGNQLKRENDGETFRGNDSMAKVFFNKGADVYFGETEDTKQSRLAGLALFYYMLDGASEECAFVSLDSEYKYESKYNEYKPALIDLFNPNSKYDIKGLFLNSVQTEEKSEKEINAEYKTNGQIELKGKISPLLNINEHLTFGFRLATESDVDSSNDYETIESTNADFSGSVVGEVLFSVIANPEPGQTYYYRAYTYDGINYNWGEERTFKISSQGGDSHTSCPDDNHPHMIDLGLPSGTKWACCNVGATTPEGYGDYFAWGETQPKDVYNWDTYQYGYYNNDGDNSHLVNIGSDIAATQYDAATAKWGAPWQMPTKDQCQELLDNCTSEWTAQNGINGYMLTGRNGGTIFLPGVGYRRDGSLYGVGMCYYLSSSLVSSRWDDAWFLYFGSSAGMSSFDRCVGLSVRPVRKN